MSKHSNIAPVGLLSESAVEGDWIELVRHHVNSLRYGTVHIVVHGGQVIQIEKTERVRLDRARHESKGS